MHFYLCCQLSYSRTQHPCCALLRRRIAQVRSKLEAINNETQALVAQLVGPENQQVFTDLVQKASMLPEQLANVVKGMADLPATVLKLVKDVLEDPDTDTAGPISQIRDMLNIASIISALQNLRDGAVDIVTKMAGAVRLVNPPLLWHNNDRFDRWRHSAKVCRAK